MKNLTEAEIEYKAAKFHKAFADLVHEYAGTIYFEQADPRLLTAMSRHCSVFNILVWRK